jgi:hypothetical protein
MIMHATRIPLGGWRATRTALGGVVAALLIVPLASGTALAWGHPCGDKPVIVVQPSDTQAGTAMAPAVVVDVDNSWGAIDTHYNGPVTLTYAVNPVGAPEPANNVVNASWGVATFSQLTFGDVGFGFGLTASITGAASAPSAPFDVVGQLVQCQPGQSCQSGTVSTAGTSGSSVAAAGSTSGFLAATAGGFPNLSCTTAGGVLTFSSSRAQTITVTYTGQGWSARHRNGLWWPFGICWGAAEPFITQNGSTSAFNPANGDYEGLLPTCSSHRGAAWGQAPPCVLWRVVTWHHSLIARVLAPAGDPHITF